MKAIILAAGIGRRLRPLTDKTHKCMLTINGKPIIRHQLDVIRDSGINDILVVGGYRIDDLISYLGNEVKFLFNPFYETTNSIVSLWLAKESVNDDLIVINSDVIYDRSLLAAMMGNNAEIAIAISKKWDPAKGYKVTIKQEKVVDMGMDLQGKEISGEYAGMIKLQRRAFSSLCSIMDDYLKQKRFDVWYETAVVTMLKKGSKADYIAVDNQLWFEIDTVEELMAAKSIIERGAEQ